MASKKYPHNMAFYTTYKTRLELELISEATKIPVSQLIRDAVQKFLDNWYGNRDVLSDEVSNVI